MVTKKLSLRCYILNICSQSCHIIDDVAKPRAIFEQRDMDSKEDIERYKKIEADYRYWLIAKYFLDKDIFGDNVFDGSKIIDGGTIKRSRFHWAESYADPVQYLKNKKSRSFSPAKTHPSISNGKLSKKEEDK